MLKALVAHTKARIAAYLATIAQLRFELANARNAITVAELRAAEAEAELRGHRLQVFAGDRELSALEAVSLEDHEEPVTNEVAKLRSQYVGL